MNSRSSWAKAFARFVAHSRPDDRDCPNAEVAGWTPAVSTTSRQIDWRFSGYALRFFAKYAFHGRQ